MKSKPLAAANSHLLVLSSGDEVIASLTEFAKQHGIEGGSFSGIGALQRATIAYWNWDTKQYEQIEVNDQVEVLALNGSLARAGDEVKIHAHVTLGRRHGVTIGGHLFQATVRPAVEIFVIDCRTRLTRRKDDETGLWLLSL
jgi:predicted DNA-binding protein with PD1-like motif